MLNPTEEIDEEYNKHFIKTCNIEEQKNLTRHLRKFVTIGA